MTETAVAVDHKHCLHFGTKRYDSDLECCLCDLKVKRIAGDLPEQYTIGQVARNDCQRKVA